MEFIEKALKVKLTFTEEVLGLSPASKEVYRDYIASKAPDAPTVADEIEAVGIDETADGKMTVFPRQDGKVGFWDYQIKGMFKDSCGGLARVKTTESAKLKAYKKIIDKLIFIEERFIPLEFDGEMLKQGVIVRHLILPLHTQESKQVLDYLKQNYDKQILVSVMSQFTPFGECDRFPEINRKLTSREIKSVNNHFLELDLDGFIQNSKSADTCFIPNWNK